MAKKHHDDDETEYSEYYEEEYDNDYSNPSNEEDEDETRYDDYSSNSSGDDFYDDSDETMNVRKKKPDILGFIVVKKGKRKNDKFDLTKKDIIIGKNPRCCDIVFDDDEVSKIHCRIRKDPDKNEFHFFDCGSTNGTLINGEETLHTILKSHDRIAIGENIELVFVQV